MRYVASLILVVLFSQDAAGTIVQSHGGLWSYNDTDNLDGVNWQDAAFDDSSWPTAASTFYSDDNPDLLFPGTLLAPGRSTYYFRTRFPGPGPQPGMVLMLNLLLDDGAVIYLNGTEVRRIRMPESPEPISHLTLATASPESGDATAIERIDLSGPDLDLLVDGENVLAVEVHPFESPPGDAAWGCLMSYQFDDSPPVFIRQPVDQNVVEGGFLTITATVDGDPRVRRQWFHNGTRLEGRTGLAYTRSLAGFDAAGEYFLVATNIHGSRTSRVARITIEPDLEPPDLVSARGYLDLTHILLLFDEWIAGDAAASLDRFEVFETANPTEPLTVLEASRTGDRGVLLRTSPRREGVHYTARVMGIQDGSSAGNVMNAPQMAGLEYEVQLLSFDGPQSWRYLASSAPPPADWTAPSFDDSTWAAGRSVFYGGTPLPESFVPATELPLMDGGAGDPIGSHLFRTRFDLPGGLKPRSLFYRTIHDDAVVISLNGVVQAARNTSTNPGATPFFDIGTAVVDPPPEWPAAVLGVESLPATDNVIAVELRQHPSGYGDAAFGMELTAVVTNFFNRPSLLLPSSVPEGAGQLEGAGQVTLNEPLSTDLVLILASSNPLLVGLPETVVIPAGQLHASFDLLVGDDNELNGARSVSIALFSSGYPTRIASLTVLDDEATTLAWTVPDVIPEVATNLTVSLAFLQPASRDVQVVLESSLPEDVVPPPFVTMPAGETKTDIAIEIRDNAWLQGSRVVVLSAEVGGWPRAETSSVLLDDEQAVLTLTVQGPVVEGGSTTGTATIGGLTPADLAIQLFSEDPASLQPPAEVLIRAGRSNAVFVVMAPDDEEPELSREVALSAVADGFPSAGVLLELLDDDPAGFEFGHIPSPQKAGQPFTVSIRAVDAAGGVVVHFNSAVTLQAVGLGGGVGISSPETGPFQNGLLQQEVNLEGEDRLTRLAADHAPGESNPFHVIPREWRMMALNAADLAWHESSGMLLATVPADAAGYTNQLVSIDPYAGVVVGSYPVAAGPGQIEQSGSGSFLYLSVSNRSGLQRVDLATGSTRPSFPVGPGSADYLVTDFTVLGSAVDGVVARLGNTGTAPSVIRFDAGLPTPLTQFQQEILRPYWLESAGSRSQTIYGYQNNNSFPLFRSQGFDGAPLILTNGLFNNGSWAGTLVLREGLLFNGNGRSVVADTFRLHADYPGAMSSANEAALPETDPGLDRVFYMTGRLQAGTGDYRIKAYDRDSGTPLGEVQLPPMQGKPGRFLRWSTNGLVFNAQGQIWFVESQRLQPGFPEVSLQLDQSLSAPPPVLGQDVGLRLVLTNAGTTLATLVTVTNTAPPGLQLSAPAASAGTARVIDNRLVWELERLDPGASADVWTTATFSRAGTFTNTATVVAFENDEDFSDNIATSVHEVSLPGDVDGVFELADLEVADLMYNPVTHRLLLAMPEGLASLDPGTGMVTSQSAPGTSPVRLIPSSDAETAYVSFRSDGWVRRIQLSDLSTVAEFEVGTVTVLGTPQRLYASDLAEIPGQPGLVAVARRSVEEPAGSPFGRGFALYLNGSLSGEPVSTEGVWRFEPDPITGELVGLVRGVWDLGNTFSLRRFDFSSGLPPMQEVYPPLAAGTGDGIEYSGAHLFSAAGRRLGFNPYGVNAIYGNGSTRLIEPEPDQDRLWLLTQDAPGWHLRLVDNDSGLERAVLPVPGVQGTPLNLIRWGSNGLAFHTTANQLFLVRTGLRRLQDLADVAVQIRRPEGPISPGVPGVALLTVTNRGPASARGLKVIQSVAPPFVIDGMLCGEGDCSFTPSSADWRLSELAPGGSVEWEVTVLPSMNGWGFLEAHLTSETADDGLLDNRAFLNLEARAGEPGNQQVIRLSATDLVWSEERSQLLLTQPDPAAGVTRLLGLDPGSLQLDLLSGLPGDGAALMVSADGLRLHATLGSEVLTLGLPALEVQQTVSGSPSGELTPLKRIAEVPATTHSFVLSRSDGQVLLSRDGMVQPVTAGKAPGEMVFGVRDDEVYGLTTSFGGRPIEFTRHQVLPGGMALGGTFPVFTPQARNVELAWVEERLLTSAGEIVDPTAQQLLGRFPAIPWESVLVHDPVTRRVFYLVQQGGHTTLQAFESRLLLPIGSQVLNPVGGKAMDLVRWGERGFAFRTTGEELHVVSSDLLPSGPAADLSLDIQSDTSQAVVGEPFEVRILVTNASVHAAGRVRIGLRLSVPLPVSSDGATAVTSPAPGLHLFEMGTVDAGGSRELRLTLAATSPGEVQFEATTLAAAPDPSFLNNDATLSLPVAFRLAMDESVTLPLEAEDLVWDAAGSRLLLSTGSDHVSVVDPYQSIVVSRWPSPIPTGALALSRDDEVLYAASSASSAVVMLDLSDGGVLNTISIEDTQSISGVEAIPGQPGSFLVSTRGSDGLGRILAYDGPVARGLRVVDNAGSAAFRFGEDDRELHALRHSGSLPPLLVRLQLSADGVVSGPTVAEMAQGARGLAHTGGLLVANTGEMIRPSPFAAFQQLPDLGAGAVVAADAGSGRVYFVTSHQGRWELRAYDPIRLAHLGSVVITNLVGTPTRLVRWGEDGLAFSTSGGQLFLFRSSLVPSGDPVDLSVRARGADPVVRLGHETEVRFTVANQGPNTARDALLVAALPAGTSLSAVEPAGGSLESTNGHVRLRWPSLEPGAERVVTVRIRAEREGWLPFHASIHSASRESENGDNADFLRVPVQIRLNLDAPIQMGFGAVDVAHDASSNRLFVALPPRWGQDTGEIAVLNPENGVVESAFDVPEDISRVVLSDDGAKLYLIVEGGSRLVRIRLSDRVQEFSTSLLDIPSGPQGVGIDLVAVPGRPDSVLVLMGTAGHATRRAMAVRFDDGIAQPQQLEVGREIEFYSSTRALASETHTVPAHTSNLELQAGGLVEQTRVNNLVQGGMSATDGLVYTSGNQVIDPGSMTVVGTLGVYGSRIVADASVGRVAVVDGRASDTVLRIVDTLGQHLWRLIRLPEARGDPERLLRAGGNRLAFLTTEQQLFLLRTGAIGADGAGSLAAGIRLPVPPPRAGEPFVVELTITNLGGTPARAARFVQSLPPDTRVLSTTAPGPTIHLPDQAQLYWDVFQLGAGMTVTNRVALRTPEGGLHSLKSVLQSSLQDANPADDVQLTLWQIDGVRAPVAIERFRVPVADVVWEPNSRRLLTSAPARAGSISNSILFMNPDSGEFEPDRLQVGDNPKQLALTEDGRYLYVGLESPLSVARVRLSDRTIDQIFPAGSGSTARQIRAVPGRNDLIAVVRESGPRDEPGGPDGVSMFLNGVPLPTPSAQALGRVSSIAMHPDGMHFLGVSASFFDGLHRVDFSEDGFFQSQTIPDRVPRGVTLESAGGRLVASSGQVLDVDDLNLLTNLPSGPISSGHDPSWVALQPAADVLSLLIPVEDRWIIRQHDWTTYTLLSEMRVPRFPGLPRNLEAWGDGNLAFTTSSNELFVVRPGLAKANVGIALLSAPAGVVAFQRNTMELMVTNHLNEVASDVVLSNLLAPMGVTIGVLSPGHLATNLWENPGLVELGDLSPHASLQLRLAFQTTSAGDLTVTSLVSVLPAFPDEDPTDNVVAMEIGSLADADRDGLPSSWEQAHGLHPFDPEDAHLDLDGDGATNLGEYLAGTLPGDSRSALRFSGVRAGGVVTFASVPGKRYQLEWSPDLPAPLWEPVGEAILAVEPSTTVALPTPALPGRHFLRVRLLTAP